MLSLITALILATPPVATTREVYVDGLRIHLVESGPVDAPPLLLLHGYLASSTGYKQLRELLSERYRVIAWDAPGHGQSARVYRRLDGAYLGTAAARLVEVLDLERVVVVGHSMGAMVGLHLATRIPQRVGHLVLVAPAGFQVDPLRLMGMRLLYQPSVYATGPELAYWIAVWGASARLDWQSEADVAEQMLLRQDPGWCWAAATVYRSIGDADAEPAAARVQVPVTLVLADDDMAYPRDYQERVIAKLPTAHVEHVADCGHNVQHNAPQQLVEIINAAAQSR